MFSYIASAAVTRGKRVLFLVHRHELVARELCGFQAARARG